MGKKERARHKNHRTQQKQQKEAQRAAKSLSALSREIQTEIAVDLSTKLGLLPKDEPEAIAEFVVQTLNRLEPRDRLSLLEQVGRAVNLIPAEGTVNSSPSEKAATILEQARLGHLRLRILTGGNGKHKVLEVSDVPPPWSPFAEVNIEDSQREILKIPADDVFRCFINSRYQVMFRDIAATVDGSGQQLAPPMVHLSITRTDKAPVRSWRDLQRIKNEILGNGSEAVEIFPSEKRLMDTSNQYHLWCLRAPHLFPFGILAGRMVAEKDGPYGARQEPFEDGTTPEDLIDPNELHSIAAKKREEDAPQEPPEAPQEQTEEQGASNVIEFPEGSPAASEALSSAWPQHWDGKAYEHQLKDCYRALPDLTKAMAVYGTTDRKDRTFKTAIKKLRDAGLILYSRSSMTYVKTKTLMDDLG